MDTCAAIWMIEGGLSSRAESEIRLAKEQGIEVLVSPITAWEIGLLVSRGRIALVLPPLSWFQTLLDEGATLAEMSPEILIAASQLPGPPLRDPSDRIIAATARAQNYRLMTRDRPILEFAAAGHAFAIPC
ncbi:type II toxin-antitoxin system VapC family toxin [Brevundimonas balnearis]|uniref:Type II toxin-antitoxin system VapC family toxin n=1 Tax=Brevundimonas balnearis TaxID=1572858 RepID=A0ABV6R6J0_9CAUL